jgi:hypothetical protein
MRVFIAHAEADAAPAAELKDFLKARGFMAETETGARAFMPLGRTDVVVGLWSKDSLFAPYRLMTEKRLLDAWADERLVLVKLDHNFLPVGLRDQPVIDASFQQARKLKAWPDIERAVRAARDAAMRPEPVEPPSPPEDMSSGPEPELPPAPPDMPAPKSAALSPIFPFALLGCALLGAGAFALVLNGLDQTTVSIIVGLCALAVLVLLAIAFAQGARSGRRTRTVPARKAAPPPAPSAVVAPSPAPAPPTGPLFVSYAHADAEQVTPVVDAVEDAGRKVWIDSGSHGGGIQAGEGWAGEIVRAIKSAGGVIIMCTPRAFESDHIKREVYLADRYRKPMLPVFLEEASPPEDFEYFFASVQWLELFRLPEDERSEAVAKALMSV